MDSPSTVSSGTPPATFDVLLETPSPPPQREGLPAGFRMRASAHYVETLDTAAGPVLRPLALSVIESESPIDASDHLVASVRRHGVLEPLVVQHDPRDRQYRLIAGRRRLAAARAAGLREVRCLVHTITDADAAALREALHRTPPDPSAHPASAAPAEPALPASPAVRALHAALSSIASCTPLLHDAAEAARRGAALVIAGECRRAQRLLTVLTVLGGEVPMRRTPVTVVDLFAALGDSVREQQALSGHACVVDVTGDVSYTLPGDRELLLMALTSALSAVNAAVEAHARHLVLSAAPGPGRGMVTLELHDRSVVLPDAFVRSAFVAPWPVADGDAWLAELQAAQRIASAHGGGLTIARSVGTTIRCHVPGEPITRVHAERPVAN